jgi:hypothetical protein
MGRGEIRVGESKDALVCVGCGWTNNVASLLQSADETVQNARRWQGRQTDLDVAGRHGPLGRGQQEAKGIPAQDE